MGAMDWELVDPWAKELRGRVEARLADFLADKRRELSVLCDESLELLDAVASLTMRGGKRLRPLVMGCAHHAVAPDAGDEAVVGAGAAVELLQSSLLIHDDWMDGDEERRGGPAAWAALRDAHGDERLGASLGVLAGDLAAAFAGELLCDERPAHGRLPEVLAAFWRMQREVFFGQHLDLVGAPDVERTYDLKTGSYTVRGPLRVGALIGDATPAQLAALDRFAEPLGVAFQLRDELLGAFGDAAALGKPTGSDLRAGKRTLLVAEARRRVPEPERMSLEGVLGRRDASDEEVARAAALLERSGARAHVEARLGELVARSRAALDGAPLEVSRLRWLSDRLTLRDR